MTGYSLSSRNALLYHPSPHPSDKAYIAQLIDLLFLTTATMALLLAISKADGRASSVYLTQEEADILKRALEALSEINMMVLNKRS